MSWCRFRGGGIRELGRRYSFQVIGIADLPLPTGGPFDDLEA
jgi:hypothetical protein